MDSFTFEEELIENDTDTLDTDQQDSWQDDEENRDPENDIHAMLSALHKRTQETIEESIRQYTVTLHSAEPMLQDMKAQTGTSLQRLWRFLRQPVWIPTKRRTLRKYSRGTLFVLDILRFGGTFALIFAVLFVALNYQSFWDITSSKLDVFLHGTTVAAPGAEDPLLPSLQAPTAQLAAERDAGDLLSYLPTVGPPENRLIIPKLKLNVPLVDPPYDALLRQDWNQVETDIQHSLQSGVVHYPGTARPGQAGNFFVTGHSSYYPWDPGKFKSVFARLGDLSVGDEYWAYYNGDKHRYVVRGKREVNPSDTSVLDQPPNARVSTLMTCTPTGTTLRRLIITAEEVNPDTGAPLTIGEKTGTSVVPKPSLTALPI